MRFSKILMTLVLLAFTSSAIAQGSSSEDEVINRYLKKTIKEQTRNMGWISANYTLNRVNKDNDYNKFASYESSNFASSSVSPLDKAHSFGFDGGITAFDNFLGKFFEVIGRFDGCKSQALGVAGASSGTAMGPVEA